MISPKDALKYCERDKFFKEYEMKKFKKKIHMLELIKREFIREKGKNAEKEPQDRSIHESAR